MSYQQDARFGRIPPAQTALFQQIVRSVRERVLDALPSHASAAIRAYTLEALLDIVLRDWRENENTAGLLDEDIRDLRSFIALAASLAGSDLSGQGAAVYQATLRGLLEDWLANWNAPNDPGPPGPID
jgi:hypothetical protein